MREAYTDLWKIEADLRVITTNGYVRPDGCCVMGRGCAREARDRFPGIDRRLGSLINEHGNRAMRLGEHGGTMIASLPVKHHWREKADLELIERSLRQLVELADKFGYENVAVARPGCGNGNLQWEGEVEPVARRILDDRFTVVTFPSDAPKEEHAVSGDRSMAGANAAPDGKDATDNGRPGGSSPSGD